ncbi:amylo-alpha-1,6-glucosidase [Paenibacillus camelliae]|uniref:amylo-alpha-1,6-glucosidase n=1 Tax=Paenibacillus camelliae TaxID=512410 RepID=UPI002040FFE6|nr:glycogen debranching N-terminal domain-containing protein [Paenibacillus camelliae]MCM3635045.1 amylo-alpha-1,6-glucosidase [Paenibacillus camelliae]
MSNKVIMEGALFYVTDSYGNVDPKLEAGHGLYMKDTRFLSHYELRINDQLPELLESSVSESYLLTTMLKHEVKDVGAVEIKRSSFLHDNVMHEQLLVTNYFLSPQQVKLTLQFDGDFQDMFIVRRYRTGEVGQRMDTTYNGKMMQLQYVGKDEQIRKTSIHWDGSPEVRQSEQLLQYTLDLAPGEQQTIQLVIKPQLTPLNANAGAETLLDGELLSYNEALQSLTSSYDQWLTSNTRVMSANSLFNTLYDRSLQDLRMLQRDIGYGATTVAGLPWFATVFGRDSIITSIFMLPLHPSHALGTLRTLAAYQGKADNPWRDEEFGKIMHEIRFGELVQTGQSPFSPYYGGVDSTPLFLVLLVEYVRWSGDLAIVDELKDSIDAALSWIDTRCQRNAAGFLTYQQEAEQGFPNQGWKDSANSIVNENGDLATAPIALVEVQGYISYAKQGLAEIFAKLNQAERSQLLKQQAEQLEERIVENFWMEDEQFFSIALDGELKPVRSVTSNAGHLLMASFVKNQYAEKIGNRLLSEDMFSGYGIRTMSNQSTGYYPMSYHNGSIWPHDNGMILLGCLRSGLQKEARHIVSGLLRAAAEVPDQRFPELFCGYSKQEYDRLVRYPTTCSPQAWSAATTFVMLQAMLGLQVNMLQGEVSLAPALPLDIQELNIVGLTIGKGTLDIYLYIDQETDTTSATILSNTTGLDVVVHS